MSLSKIFIPGSRRPGNNGEDDRYLDPPTARRRGGSWLFRYSPCGKAKSLGRGARTRDPDEVWAQAARFREWLGNGIDPRSAGAEAGRIAAAELARRVTFCDVAEALLARAAPRVTRATYALPAEESLTTAAE